MTAFGIITLNSKLEQHYFTEMAKLGASHSIDVYRFSPLSIDPKTEQVHGEKFNSNSQKWEKTIYPIPEFLYDRCFYSSKAQQKKYFPIINWLKNRKDLVFIGHGLPNKWTLHKYLATHPLLSYYIPRTIKANSADDVFHYLKRQKKIILKPENGSQGKGIIGLEQKDPAAIELFTQQHQKIIHKQFTSKDDLYTWVTKLVSTHAYLMQPFLALQDESGKPFDIRILVQKNPNNEWKETGRGIRKGLAGGIISNLHGGGDVSSYEQWIEQFDQHQRVLIEDEINTLLTSLPEVLDQQFGPLFEIGIDIGLATDGTIWVLDTNSKPGYKTIIQSKPSLEKTIYESPLLYCKHLALQRSEHSDGII